MTGLIYSTHPLYISITLISVEVFKMKADKKIQLERKFNALIGRSLERLGGKLNELEVIVLQYILVRESVFVADIRDGWSFDLKWKDKPNGTCHWVSG